MLRDRLIALAAASLIAACSGTEGRQDAATGLDRADPFDAGVVFDGRAPLDSGAALDAAPGRELGPGEDARVESDAEPASDAEPSADAAQDPDAEPGADAAEPDTGEADAGFAPDAAMRPCPQGSGAGTTPAAAMSFFATSVGNGAFGGDYGGLAGADDRCACLAAQVGLGHKTWRAYLSVAPFGVAQVDARDRIGTGPWFNYAGTQIAASVAGLHASPPDHLEILTERGERVPAAEHDILTGSAADGTLQSEFPGNPAAPAPTCSNWTDGTSNSFGWVGHSDWNDPRGAVTSWNGDHSTPCDPAGLASRNGSGRIYCFAID